MVDVDVASYRGREALYDGSRFGKLQRLAVAGADKVNVFTVHGNMALACFHIHVSVGIGGANETVRFQRRVKVHRFFLPEEPVVYALEALHRSSLGAGSRFGRRQAAQSVLFVKLRCETAAAAGDGVVI